MTNLAGLLAAFLLVSPSATAQEPIRMARTPDISPDGKQIAFSYLGDIWSVAAIGGVAHPVTQHVAHDTRPCFSPDGRSLAFASNRHGSYDVFVVSARGGKPLRLTFDSADDYPSGWSPDGSQVLFVSGRSIDFPGNSDLYTVAATGGRVHRVTSTEARDGVYSPNGNEIAYVRGPGSWYRRNYRGSSNNDIWLCEANGSNHRQLTSFNGQDNAPMWAADGKSLFYVSESLGGAANIVRQAIDPTAKPTLITADTASKPFHTLEGVRQARISHNGEWIAYECGPDIWVVSTKSNAQPRRVAIEVHADDKTNPERSVTFTNKATEFALSRDEAHVAFVVHGEIFLRPVLTTNVQTRRLTNSPANDHGLAWAPDASKIVFLSDRNGHEDLYLLEANDPEHPKFTEAHQFKVKQLTNTSDAEAGVMFSPDGKRVTFIRNGRLWGMNPDGTDLKVIVDSPRIVDYEWAPDGKWIVYSRVDGSFASELYIIPADGSGEVKNVTRFATENIGVTWSNTGNRLCFLSTRRGQTGVYVMNLQKDLAPGAATTSDIDWDDIHHRVKQVSNMEARESAINSSGSMVAFASSSQGSDDLWVANVTTGSTLRLTTGNMRPTQITWSRRNSNMIFFRDGQGQIHLGRIPLDVLGSSTTSTSSNSAPLSFKAKMTVNDPELFLEMFDQSWRYLADQFYDRAFHGADWTKVRERYRPLVKHVALKEDLYSLLYLMMGELNASHLGVSGFGNSAEEATADLGLLFDETYRGRGLKIAEVLKRGPADKRGLSLKAGEFVLAIDGEEITPTTNVSALLNDKVNEFIVLLISTNAKAELRDKAAVRRLEVRGLGREQTAPLMYERWIEVNAKKVADLSGGKLGYIHIPSMNEAGLDRFVRSLYSDNFDKEAIVLDVRYNGGGFTHDQVLNYFGSKAHTIFKFRDGGEGLVIRSNDRKWAKPSVLLINNRSYSDAEIFPHAFRTLGLGKLVGQATGGHVIGTTTFALIDGSRFRIPRIGVYTVGGINMDKEGVKPDVEVTAHPDQMVKGIDPQLEKAVEVLKSEVTAWKRKTTGVTSKDGSSSPMPPASEK